MTKRKRAEWHIRVHGEQRDEVKIDLLAQIIIMLGRQLAREALTTDDVDSTDSTAGEEEL